MRWYPAVACLALLAAGAVGRCPPAPGIPLWGECTQQEECCAPGGFCRRQTAQYWQCDYAADRSNGMEVPCVDRKDEDGDDWRLRVPREGPFFTLFASCNQFSRDLLEDNYTSTTFSCTQHADDEGSARLTVTEACCVCQTDPTDPLFNSSRLNSNETNETTPRNESGTGMRNVTRNGTGTVTDRPSGAAEPTVGSGSDVIGVASAASVLIGGGAGLAMRQVLALDRTCFVSPSAALGEDPEGMLPGGGAAKQRALSEGSAMQHRAFIAFLHPTQLTVLGMTSAGMVVGGFIICGCATILILLLAACAPKSSHLAPLSDLGLIQVPSAALVPFMYFLQGISLGAFYLFFQIPSWGAYGVGFTAIVVCAVVLFYLAVQLRGGMKSGQAVYMLDTALESKWMEFLIGPGEWVARKDSLWIQRYAVVMRLYRREVLWFPVIDMASSLTLSGIHSVQTQNYSHCGLVKMLSAGLFSILLVLTVMYWPHARVRDAYTWIIILAVQTASATAFSIGFYNIAAEDTPVVTNTIRHCFDAGSLLATVAVVVIVMNLILDIVAVGYVITSGRVARLQTEAEALFDDVEKSRTDMITSNYSPGNNSPEPEEKDARDTATEKTSTLRSTAGMASLPPIPPGRKAGSCYILETHSENDLRPPSPTKSPVPPPVLSAFSPTSVLLSPTSKLRSVASAKHTFGELSGGTGQSTAGRPHIQTVQSRSASDWALLERAPTAGQEGATHRSPLAAMIPAPVPRKKVKDTRTPPMAPSATLLHRLAHSPSGGADGGGLLSKAVEKTAETSACSLPGAPVVVGGTPHPPPTSNVQAPQQGLVAGLLNGNIAYTTLASCGTDASPSRKRHVFGNQLGLRTSGLSEGLLTSPNKAGPGLKSVPRDVPPRDPDV
eukprot:TRINITY_DN18972_c0_g1_i1.p1 TRINITY_DN18972_c0_g1~~TRINITY_DN18972_c0_g1_i1.p1  ORF type:complete len:892 (+),score=139.99 TRINITY_DN18972_c0_g1_i1:80-2755(+)